MVMTPQKKRFVEELLHGGTQGDAAIRAGYAPKYASTQASALLAQPEVRQALKESREALGERLGITPERILQELAIVGFASAEHYMTEDEDGNRTLDVNKLKGNGARAFALEFESTSTGKETVRKTKAKQLDKKDALIAMGKQIGMFAEKVEHQVSMSLEQLVADSFKEKKADIIPEPAPLPEEPSVSVSSDEVTPSSNEPVGE